MTIVLQHQFWNLAVHETEFEVELSFDNIPEKLVIPFNAIKGFLDPAVQFGLQFETVPVETAPNAAETAPNAIEAAPNGAPKAAEAAPKIVSLDSFRKK
jgi:hypothetical protein